MRGTGALREPEGNLDGESLGAALGEPDGFPDGKALESALGVVLGEPDGDPDGRGLGATLGEPDGAEVGAAARKWVDAQEIRDEQEREKKTLDDIGTGGAPIIRSAPHEGSKL